MFGKPKKQLLDDRINEWMRSLAQSASLSAEETEAVASQISFASLRARIRAQQAHTPANGLTESWLATLLAVRIAIPAMALIALLALTLPWFLQTEAAPNTIDTALTGATGAGIERVQNGGTCAISTSDQCAVSTEEVLATIVSSKAAEEKK